VCGKVAQKHLVLHDNAQVAGVTLRKHKALYGKASNPLFALQQSNQCLSHVDT
jgi:hypothetical protein